MRVSSRNSDGSHTRWPALPYVIVVEGANDKRAVQAATASEVFALHGALHAVDDATIKALRATLEQRRPKPYHGIIVLMDPDVAGRQGRMALDAAFGDRCWHAFLPAADATAQLRTKWHDAGNVGVEHAAPDAIQHAILTARLAQPRRAHFMRDDLVELHLIAEMGKSASKGGRSAPLRREIVGELLGIGMCDGRQLMRQLNIFGFTLAELAAATALAEQLLPGQLNETRDVRFQRLEREFHAAKARKKEKGRAKRRDKAENKLR